MCEHDGTFKSQAIVRLAHPRNDGVETVGVDPCIAPIVQALNDAGIQTLASCCGHGHRPGSIVLEDGREILIARSRDEARRMDAGFPDIHGMSAHQERDRNQQAEHFRYGGRGRSRVREVSAVRTRADFVRPHERSISLGGGMSLFPLDPDTTDAFAKTLRAVIKEAEEIAYAQGREDAQAEMRKALGIEP